MMKRGSHVDYEGRWVELEIQSPSPRQWAFCACLRWYKLEAWSGVGPIVSHVDNMLRSLMGTYGAKFSLRNNCKKNLLLEFMLSV